MIRLTIQVFSLLTSVLFDFCISFLALFLFSLFWLSNHIWTFSRAFICFELRSLLSFGVGHGHLRAFCKNSVRANFLHRRGDHCFFLLLFHFLFALSSLANWLWSIVDFFLFCFDFFHLSVHCVHSGIQGLLFLVNSFHDAIELIKFELIEQIHLFRVVILDLAQFVVDVSEWIKSWTIKQNFLDKIRTRLLGGILLFLPSKHTDMSYEFSCCLMLPEGQRACGCWVSSLWQKRIDYRIYVRFYKSLSPLYVPMNPLSMLLRNSDLLIFHVIAESLILNFC